MMSETQTQTPPALFDSRIDTRFEVRQICPKAAGLELERVQFDEDYRAAAEKKYHHIILKASDLSAPGANVLKQTCLSLGTDAGVHRGAINCTIDREAVLITATQAQLERLVLKLRPQPFGLKLLAESITRMLQRQRRLGNRPLEVMAILNTTPDSFSDGGRLMDPEAAVAAAGKALAIGADWLDVGGESTRPGAEEVPIDEELSRVIPVIEAIHKAFPEARMSVDTRKAAVARAALAAGAQMVNDVSGMRFEPEMAAVVAEARCPIVLMHSQGTPLTMQEAPQYHDVVGEVSRFLYGQVAAAVEAGIAPENIILDPGFGFGKTLDHNLALMRRLREIVSIGFPVLVGTSRKSFLTMGAGDRIPTHQREALTAASLAAAVQAGARLLRVHDLESQMPVVDWLKGIYLPETYI